MANPTYDITDTVKNKKQLDAQSPKSGRVIKEDNTVINLADAITTVEGNLAIRTS
jgi:hypothetical protein